MRNALPTIAAVLLPVAVLAGAFAWLTHVEPPAPVDAEVAGRWFKGDQPAAANDAVLAQNPPGMVVVGNSKATSDVDGRLLAKALGYTKPVAQVKALGSSAPAWYAILEHRVFGAGYKPEVVVVYGQLVAMLRTEVGRPSERLAIEEQLAGGASPVLEAKVLGSTTSPSARARKKATQAHEALLEGVRDLAVGLFLAPPSPDGVLAAGHTIAEPALENLLGANARFLKGGGARVVPVAEVGEKSAPMSLGDTAPRDSLLPDIVALAKANGAKVIFVRAPLPASNRHADLVPAETEREALQLLNELGVSWLDLSGIPLPAEAFGDDFHGSPVGNRLITTALAEAMLASDVLGDGIAKARPPVIPASVARAGTMPALPAVKWAALEKFPCFFRAPLKDLEFLSDDALFEAGFGRASPLVVAGVEGPLTAHAPVKGLGEECTGGWRHRKHGLDAAPVGASAAGLEVSLADEPAVPEERGEPVWWVYPGTSVEWRFEEPLDAERLLVTLDARAVRGTGGSVQVGDATARLEPNGRTLRARLDAPAPTGPWTLTVTADADTWLVLDELLLGDVAPQRLLGEPTAPWNLFVSKMQPAADPPPVETGPIGEDGPLTRIPIPALAFLADEAVQARVDKPCSPVQLGAESEGDKWMQQGHLPVQALKKPGRRGFGHVGGDLLLAPPGGEMPAGPWRVRLDPSRKCAGGMWIYGGDALTFPVLSDAAEKFRLGPDMLVVEGAALYARETPGEGRLRAKIVGRQGKNVYEVQGELTLPTTGPATRACLRFDQPVRAGIRLDLTLEGVDPDAWFYLKTAQLGESEHMGGCEP